jgi:hypothetical protein
MMVISLVRGLLCGMKRFVQRWLKRPPLPVARGIRLQLEQLEDRTVPADVNIWTNGLGTGAWEADGNWSRHHAPRQDEIARFLDDPTLPDDQKQCSIPAGTTPTIYGLEIQPSWTAKLTIGEKLTVTNMVMQEAGNLVGGTLEFLGQENGIYTWKGGSRTSKNLEADNPVIALTKIQGQGQLKVTGPAMKILAAATVEVRSNGIWDGGDLIVMPHSWLKVLEGTFTVTNGAGNINAQGASDAGVQVSSTFNVSANQELLIKAKFVNSGSVNVTSGSLKLDSGSTFNANSTTSIAANSKVILEGHVIAHELKGTTFSGNGNVEVTGRADVTNLNTVVGLNQAPGSKVTGTGTLSIGGTQASLWAGGEWNGAGKVEVKNGSVLNISGAAGVEGLLMKEGWDLDIKGTVNLTANQKLLVNRGTQITNHGTFNIQGGSRINSSHEGAANNPVAIFDNFGSLVASGANENTIETRVTNKVAASQLRVNNNTLTIFLGLTQEAGETYLNGGNLIIFAGDSIINGGTLKGHGTIQASLLENKGTIDQTSLGGFQELIIEGNYKQGATGELKLKINQVNGALVYDKLRITNQNLNKGQATLDGKLTLVAQPGYVPAPGDDATVMDFNGHVGDFPAANITLPAGMKPDPRLQSYHIVKLKPNVILMVPNAGPIFGGTLVTITGEGFLGATAVTFGGVAANFTVISDSEIQAYTPPHIAGCVDVVVANPIESSLAALDQLIILRYAGIETNPDMSNPC